MLLSIQYVEKKTQKHMHNLYPTPLKEINELYINDIITNNEEVHG